MEQTESEWYTELSRRASHASLCINPSAVSGKCGALLSLWRITIRPIKYLPYLRSRRAIRRAPDWSVANVLTWHHLGHSYQKQLRWETLRAKFLADYVISKKYIVTGSALSSTEVLASRSQLYLLKSVADELERWYASLPKAALSDHIGRATFLYLYRRLVSLLLPAATNEEACVLTVADWLCDMKSKDTDEKETVARRLNPRKAAAKLDTVSKAQFKWSILGLAMVWVETGSEHECVEFVHTIRSLLQTDRSNASFREADVTLANLSSCTERGEALLQTFSRQFHAYQGPAQDHLAATDKEKTPSIIPVHHAVVWMALLGSTSEAAFAKLEFAKFYYSSYAMRPFSDGAQDSREEKTEGTHPTSPSPTTQSPQAMSATSGGEKPDKTKRKVHHGRAPRRIGIADADANTVAKITWRVAAEDEKCLVEKVGKVGCGGGMEDLKARFLFRERDAALNLKMKKSPKKPVV